MAIETIYLTNENIIDLILKSEDDDGVLQPQSLESVSEIKLHFPELNLTLSSNNGETDVVKWDQVDYDTGEIRLFLKDVDEEDLPPRHTPYVVYIVVYDVTNPDGLVWDNILVRVKLLDLN
jgi:hypothetical protein